MYRGYWVCLIFTILLVITVGQTFGLGLMLSPVILRSWSHNIPTECLVVIGPAFSLLAAPIGTILYNKFGTRKVVWAGTIMVLLGFVMTTIKNNFLLMLSLVTILVSFGLVLVENPPMMLLEEYFPRHHPRHAFATGIVVIASPLGTLIFYPITINMFITMTTSGICISFGVIYLLAGLLCGYFFISPTTITKIKPSSEVTGKQSVILGGLWTFASFIKGIAYTAAYINLINFFQVTSESETQMRWALVIFGITEILSRTLMAMVADRLKGGLVHTYAFLSFMLALVCFTGSFLTAFFHWVLFGVAIGTFGGPFVAGAYSSGGDLWRGRDLGTAFTLFEVGLGWGSVLATFIQYDTFGKASIHIDACATGGLYLTLAIIYIVIIGTSNHLMRGVVDVISETSQEDSGGESKILLTLKGSSSPSYGKLGDGNEDKSLSDSV